MSNVDSKGCADDDASESSENSSDFEWDEEDDATRSTNDRQSSIEADENSKMNKKHTSALPLKIRY